MQVLKYKKVYESWHLTWKKHILKVFEKRKLGIFRLNREDVTED
jgi:hypothetical protein